jgi:hypothetical protein
VGMFAMQATDCNTNMIFFPITPSLSILDVCTNKAPLPSPAQPALICPERNKPTGCEGAALLDTCQVTCQGRLLIRQALCSLIDPSWL